MKKGDRRKQAKAKNKATKPRRKQRRNPIYGKGPMQFDDDLLVAGLAGFIGGMTAYLSRSPIKPLDHGPYPKLEECPACDGTCLCHHVGPLGGVPCPPDCPSIGTRLDGCHRCDCAPVKKGDPR